MKNWLNRNKIKNGRISDFYEVDYGTGLSKGRVLHLWGAQTAPQRLTDSGCTTVEAAEEEVDVGGAEEAWPPWSGHICAGNLGKLAKEGPGKGERGAGW